MRKTRQNWTKTFACSSSFWGGGASYGYFHGGRPVGLLLAPQQVLAQAALKANPGLHAGCGLHCGQECN